MSAKNATPVVFVYSPSLGKMSTKLAHVCGECGRLYERYKHHDHFVTCKAALARAAAYTQALRPMDRKSPLPVASALGVS